MDKCTQNAYLCSLRRVHLKSGNDGIRALRVAPGRRPEAKGQGKAEGTAYAMSEDKRARRRPRRPTLRSALAAAKAAGKAVRSATIDPDGKVTITFGEPAADATDDWDKKLEELERGKH